MSNRFRQVSFVVSSTVLPLLLQPLIHYFSLVKSGREASDPECTFKGNLARTIALNHLSKTISNHIIAGLLFSLQEDFWFLKTVFQTANILRKSKNCKPFSVKSKSLEMKHKTKIWFWGTGNLNLEKM